MKINLLVTAIATASVMASSGVMARGDIGSDALKTALGNSTLGFEAYGGYMDSSLQITGEPDQDKSDFHFDKLRLGLNGTLKQDVTYGFEAEWLLDESNLTDSSNDENDLRVNDLFLERAFGTTAVTLGRYKQLADRQNNIEMRDRVFTYGGGSVYGAIGDLIDNSNLIGSTGLDIDSNLLDNLFGADRRVDGLGVRHYNDSGLHGSFNIYKGGVNQEDDPANGSSVDELSRNFGYAGSIGWLGGSDNLTFGVTFAAYQEDGAEMEDNNGTQELEASGYSIEAILAAGAFNAGLTYGDNSLEYKDTGVSAVEDLELDTDAIGVWGVFNIGSAARSFNQFGVLQGPSVKPGSYGYEVGFQYSSGDIEAKDGSSSGKIDQDSWGLAMNMYCGSFTKWFIEYNTAEFGDNSEVEYDALSIGGRIAF